MGVISGSIIKGSYGRDEMAREKIKAKVSPLGHKFIKKTGNGITEQPENRDKEIKKEGSQ